MNYFVWLNEKQEGPFEEQQIQAMLREGQIGTNTPIYSSEVSSDWLPAGEVFEAELNTLPAPPSPAGPKPPPITSPPPLPETQHWFGTPNDVIRIRLVSGTDLTVSSIRLFHDSELKTLAENRAHAMELLKGVSAPMIPIGSATWVATMTMFNRYLEKRESEKLGKEGLVWLAKVDVQEREVAGRGAFFPVGRIQSIEHPIPSMWRVPVPTGAFVYNGADFIGAQCLDGAELWIRWGAVESYFYEPPAGEESKAPTAKQEASP